MHLSVRDNWQSRVNWLVIKRCSSALTCQFTDKREVHAFEDYFQHTVEGNHRLSSWSQGGAKADSQKHTFFQIWKTKLLHCKNETLDNV